jgi:hypothetical protein
LEREPRRETPSRPPLQFAARGAGERGRGTQTSVWGRETGWMGAWALLGGGSRNGGGKLERGGVSEPKPRAPPAPAHVNPTAAARACVRNSGEARARAVACARGLRALDWAFGPAQATCGAGPPCLGSTRKFSTACSCSGPAVAGRQAKGESSRAGCALMGSSTDKVGTGPAWQAFQLEAGCSLDRNRPILIAQWASITTKPDFPSPARPVVRASITRPAQACAGMAAATFIAV